ncbi:flippase [Candidatus Magnetominusculus dajiuhuensis]|uniref:flippase n=1 Tax=Candidatus Magnetominusculus dajiuhuensis TaxID=3137712 RepID=UPI003B43ACC0
MRPNEKDFVKASDGTYDFGRIDKEVADAIGGKEAPIRLQAGDEKYGEYHFNTADNGGRIKKIKAAGYKNAKDFVEDVCKNWDEIRQGSGTSKWLIRKNGRYGMTAIELKSDHGAAHYIVITGGIFRKGYAEGKKLLRKSGAPYPLDRPEPSTPIPYDTFVKAQEGITERTGTRSHTYTIPQPREDVKVGGSAGPPPENPIDLLARNYVFILISRILRIGTGFMLLFGLARSLGVSDFGNFIFITNLTASVMSVAFYGIGQTLVREVSGDRGRAAIYIGIAFKLRGYFTIAAFSSLVIVSIIMKVDKVMFTAILIASLSEIFRAFSDLAKDVFRAYEKMRYEMFITTIYSAVVLALVSTLILLKGGYAYVIAAICVANAVQLFISVRIMAGKFTRPARVLPKELFKTFIVNSFSLGLGVLFAQLLARVPALFLKELKGAADVAFFETGHGLIIQTLILSEIFVTVFLPRLSILVSENDFEKIKRTGRKLFKFFLLFSVNISIVFFIFSKELVLLLYGTKYAPSAGVLRLLSFAVAFLFITNFIHIFLISLKMQKEFVLCNLAPFIFVCVSMYFTVPAYGFMGAAASGISAYFVSFAVSCYIMHRRIVKIPVVGTLKIFMAAIFVIIGSMAIEGVWASVRFMAVEAAFVLLVLALRAIDDEEWAFVKETAMRLNVMKYLRFFRPGR